MSSDEIIAVLSGTLEEAVSRNPHLKNT